MSAVTTVYTFGFIAMTPQLFINYKLKSVAHLPWRFLVLRALNTFIDDLFAFIIRMPTMHRLSCFRDDLVFFIYMYQRWCYPVDVTRQSVGVEDDEIAGAGAAEVGPNSVVTTKKEHDAKTDTQAGTKNDSAPQNKEAAEDDLQQQQRLLEEGLARVKLLVEKGIEEYKEYYKVRNTDDAASPLKRADNSFNAASTISEEYLPPADGEARAPPPDK